MLKWIQKSRMPQLQTLLVTAQATSHERSSPVFKWSLIMKDTVPVQGWRKAIMSFPTYISRVQCHLNALYSRCFARHGKQPTLAPYSQHFSENITQSIQLELPSHIASWTSKSCHGRVAGGWKYHIYKTSNASTCSECYDPWMRTPTKGIQEPQRVFQQRPQQSRRRPILCCQEESGHLALSIVQVYSGKSTVSDCRCCLLWHFAATHLLQLRDTPKAPPACPSQRPIHRPVTRKAKTKFEVYALLPLDANLGPIHRRPCISGSLIYVIKGSLDEKLPSYELLKMLKIQ